MAIQIVGLLQLKLFNKNYKERRLIDALCNKLR